MATPRSQRVGIWIIAIAMVIGTLGSFFIFLLPSSKEPLADNSQADLQKQIEEYQKQMEEQAKQRAASSQPLEGYAAEAFDPAAITELQTEDLIVGDGKEVLAESTISASYFGWTSDGKLFDSSNQNGTVTPAEFPLNGVITGWKEGLVGAREGSVRKLMIPADKAYGSQTTGGQPAGPLMFIVRIESVK